MGKTNKKSSTLILGPLGYSITADPGVGGRGCSKGTTFPFYIIDHRSITMVCMFRSTNYLWILYCYVLCLPNLLAVATMATCIWLIFVNKLKQVKKKDNHSHSSTILITDRQS